MAKYNIYHPGSSANQYFDADGNMKTLYHMVRDEPDWAIARIRVCESLEARISAFDAFLLDRLNYYNEIVCQKKNNSNKCYQSELGAAEFIEHALTILRNSDSA